MKLIVSSLALIVMIACINWCVSFEESSRFMEMIRSGNVRALEMVRRNGELLNVRSSWGYTPLMVAAYEGDLEMVRELVAVGADPNGGDRPGETALLIACWSPKKSSERRQIVRFLLERGANPNTVIGCGFTPLLCAVEYDDPELVRLLLHHGANPWIDRCYVPHELGEGKGQLMGIAESGRNWKPIVRMLSEARLRWKGPVP